MTNEHTAGTPGQDDGDAAAQTPTTGTPGTDDRDGGSGEPNYKAMYLESKTKVEEANRLKAENEELRQRAAQPPAAQDDDEPLEPDDDGVDWDQVRAHAKLGDVACQAQLATKKRQDALDARQEQLARATINHFDLRDIEDKDERAEIQKHFVQSARRGRPLPDIRAARAEIRESRLGAEVERLRKENEALQKQPPKDVISTHARSVTSSEAKEREMTEAQYDAKVDALKAQGRFKEARAMGIAYAKDEIRIKR